MARTDTVTVNPDVVVELTNGDCTKFKAQNQGRAGALFIVPWQSGDAAIVVGSPGADKIWPGGMLQNTLADQWPEKETWTRLFCWAVGEPVQVSISHD